MQPKDVSGLRDAQERRGFKFNKQKWSYRMKKNIEKNELSKSLPSPKI